MTQELFERAKAILTYAHVGDDTKAVIRELMVSNQKMQSSIEALVHDERVPPWIRVAVSQSGRHIKIPTANDETANPRLASPR